MSSRVHLFLRVLVVCGLVLACFTQLQNAASAAEGRCRAGVLDLACEATKTVLSEASEVATAPVRVAAGGAVDVITAWVAEGTTWLLRKVVNFIDDSSSPELGAAWFTARYRFMVGLAGLVLLPILLIAAMRAVINQDASQLLRSFFVYLPIAVFSTFVAVFLTRTLLSITDSLSASVAEGIAGDLSQMFGSIERGLGTVGTPAAPSFAIFVGALLVMVGAFFVWLELLIRSAAVTVSVFFLPLVLVGLVWPTTARWTRRLIETLVALILSKFVIVAVISLASAALAEPADDGFGSIMGGAALMLTAAFSPMALLKLIPLAEAAGMAHLEGIGRKPVDTIRAGGSVNQAVSIMRSKVGRVVSSPAAAVAGSAGAAAVATRASTRSVPAVAASLGSTNASRSRTQPGTSASASTGSSGARPRPPAEARKRGGRAESGGKADG